LLTLTGRSLTVEASLAKDDLLVPPAPFRATFEAKWYEPWHYGDEKWRGKEGIISLKPGEVLNLTIRLQRDQSGSGLMRRVRSLHVKETLG
jgi:hypothetical protein